MWNDGHVSFSEVSAYQKCGWSHKLLYIDELSKDISINPPSMHTAWGSALHNSIENLLNDNIKSDDVDEFFLKELEKQNSDLPNEILNDEKFDKFQIKIKDYSPRAIKSVPDRLQEILGDYTVLGTEIQFKQPISELFYWSDNPTLKERDVILNTKFKGFIDCVILDSKGKFHIFDWKTTEKGWHPYKRKDPTTTYQLAIYKSMLMSSIKLHSDNDNAAAISKKIKCHFLLFKPGDKPMEDYTPSVGPKVMNDALEWVNRAVVAIDRELFLKNFNSCRFCPFAGTDYCSGSSKYMG